MGIQNFGPDHDLGLRLSKLEADVLALSTRDVLQNASIGIGGLTVNGTGGITVTGGGSITISGTGVLNVASGGLNSSGSITAATFISAGGAITGASIAVTGLASSVTSSTTGNSTVGGDINLIGDLYTPHGKATPVTVSYVSAWLNGDGRLGATASTRASKRDLIPLTDLTGIMALTPYLGRYIWDEDDSPLKVFLIAEDVQAAGFGPDVAPVDESGEAFTVNYSQLVVPLLAAVQSLTARLDAAGL